MLKARTWLIWSLVPVLALAGVAAAGPSAGAEAEVISLAEASLAVRGASNDDGSAYSVSPAALVSSSLF